MSSSAPRVQVESRAEWRAWLKKNHAKSKGIWLVTFKKAVPAKYVSYDAIVEEALCFGWIDSLPRKLDDERTMLYVCPRKKGSPWSALNKKRIAALTKKKLIEGPGLAVIDRAKKDGSWAILDDVEKLVIPDDLTRALKANAAARKYFNAFSDSVKKNILWWIKSAKRDETRKNRIAETVRLATDNIKANHPRQ